MGKRFAVLIGMAHYPADEKLTTLRGPPNDVRKLAEVLSDPARGEFEVVKLIDVSHHEVVSSLETVFGAAGTDDVVFVYYSGHGKLDFRRNLYLAAADTDMNRLVSTSLSIATVKTLIDLSRARASVIVLDCCFSGAVSGAFVKGAVSEQVSLINENLASDAHGTGVHIFTSSSSSQTSLEKESEADGEVLGNFTRLIHDGISTGAADRDADGEIGIDDLKAFVAGGIRGQSPQYWGVRTSGQLSIAHAPNTTQQFVESARSRLQFWFEKALVPEPVFRECIETLGRMALRQKYNLKIGEALRRLDREELTPAQFLRATGEKSPPPVGLYAAATAMLVVFAALASIGGYYYYRDVHDSEIRHTSQSVPEAVGWGRIVSHWVQFNSTGAAEARVAVTGHNCPPINFGGNAHAMYERAQPSANFPVRLCTAILPDDVTIANAGGVSLPVPLPTPTRILVLGASGCRIKGVFVQSCNDRSKWEFPAIAQAAAKLKPNLIVYVGDYISRESPCPVGNGGCKGSPYGDNWPTWMADFLGPMGPLLNEAPAVFARSNHADCVRARNWVFLLGGASFDESQSCHSFAPVAISFAELKMIVFDSAEAFDSMAPQDSVRTYRAYFDSIPDLTVAEQHTHNPVFLLAGRPLGGVINGPLGKPIGGNATMLAALNPKDIAPISLTISGQIHAFELLNFRSGLPPQLVARPSGGLVDDAPPGSALPGVRLSSGYEVADGTTVGGQGFVMMVKIADAWRIEVHDSNGALTQACVLQARRIQCPAP